VTITVYRIVKAEYRNAIWSGSGARDLGGRWNSKGVSVIYTAQNRSLAALEQLVHLIRLRILNGYVLADISFDDARMQRLQPDDLPSGWNDPVAPATLKAYGDDWIAAGNYLVLAVPSAIIRGEWNYLINPTHPEFNALIKSNPESFMYDHRLA
jgi:RES domain-containing protein